GGGDIWFREDCLVFHQTVVTLSDVVDSLQSIPRYQPNSPPVCALLPVKAVTGIAALSLP
ncbi:hypothetical protein L195_g064702, partial [Trifolium pratense]